MKGSKKSGIKLWAIIFWLLVWQGCSMLLSAAYPNGHLLLASPINAAIRLCQLAVTGKFWSSVAYSALRIFGGFLISAILAVALASLSAAFLHVRELLAPVVSAIKTVPVASFIILALVWLNSRSLSLFISALMVFPPIYANVLEGIGHTDRKLLEMAWVFRIPLGARIKRIYFPQTLPYFRSAVSIALGLCWKAGIAAEVIGLPSGSIGERLYHAKVYYETADLFAWTAAIVLLSVGIEKLVLALLRRADRSVTDK